MIWNGGETHIIEVKQMKDKKKCPICGAELVINHHFPNVMGLGLVGDPVIYYECYHCGYDSRERTVIRNDR